MKITQSKAKDLMTTISVEVKAEDYTEKVDETLKNYRKTAQIPGFRKGKTPMGIINKKYRTSVVVEEVNKLLQDELYKHITGKKLRVLGSPMPIDSKPIDWENNEDFMTELLSDKKVLKYLTKDQIKDKFDINYHTKHVDTIFKRVFK